MINRKTLAGLAALTLVLFVAGTFIGADNDFLWVVDDIVFIGFVLSAVALIAMSVAVLVRAASSRRGTSSRTS